MKDQAKKTTKRNFIKPGLVFSGWFFIVWMGWISCSFAMSKKEQDYVQLLPIVPMFHPYAPSQNYLCVKEPVSPWKVTPKLPTPEEVKEYQGKLEAIRKLQTKPVEKAAPKVIQGIPDSDFQPVIFVPKLRVDSGEAGQPSQPSAPPASVEAIVSPWLNISPVLPNTSPQVQPSNPDSSTLPWMRKPTGGGSDLYIPLPAGPGYNQPTSSSSAVIYTQPESPLSK